MYIRINVSMYLCIFVSMYLYIYTSIYLYIYMSICQLGQELAVLAHSDHGVYKSCCSATLGFLWRVFNIM